MATNWIRDENRFKLAGPPQWWLTKLGDFDRSLVVIPSRQGFYYRLAQRRKLTLNDKMTQDVLFKESDTQMMARYGLVPVTTILATANWGNPLMFEELRKRAPWRLGGAAAVNKMLDEQEQRDELDRRAKTDEVLTATAKDAWGLYNKKIGLRSQMWSPTVPRKSIPSFKIA